MDSGNVLRVVLVNAGLLVAVLPVPSQVRLLTALLALCAFAAFLPLLILAVLYAVRAKHAGQNSIHRSPVPRHVPEPAGVTRRRNTGQAALAMTLVTLAVAVGYALAR
jgi:nitrite reductase (NO-forming)